VADLLERAIGILEVRVYDWNGTSWIQRGGNINGERDLKTGSARKWHTDGDNQGPMVGT